MKPKTEMNKPSLPQGTRDFGAETIHKRNHIFSIIRRVFEVYGFQPLETPAMENLDTLLGKYGEEGDKLIFRILNNGLDNPSRQEEVRADFEKVLAGKNSKGITERALRYDLTIPFARYVAMNHGQLAFPFRRYQIQPVWRADRPQKGRYREFYQCDADVVGSNSLINEVEMATIYAEVFQKLGINVTIKINSRKVLTALAEICGLPGSMMDITVAIDKLDKIGLEKVKEELSTRGLNDTQVSMVEKYLLISGSGLAKLAALKDLFKGNETGNKGIAEMEYVLNNQSFNYNIEPDLTLARGLNYYTGIIFEVKALNVQMGSIGGGGRYDDLTGLFGVPGIPGVGISFGVDRIYDVMDELKLFPEGLGNTTQVLFFNLGEEESRESFRLLQLLREKGISGELFHENTKFDRQFKYAEKKHIRYIIIIGQEELKDRSCKVKNLDTGDQVSLSQEKLLEFNFI
jgi:histidyl-tRNA synthetase